MSKIRIEKNRRFEKISVTFLSFLTQNESIGIYRKTGPTKSTVLGPGPPPWEIHKFYRFLLIFVIFGVFNTAGKSVSKIGIYALPPLKSEFYRFLIVRDPISSHGSTIHDSLYVAYCLFLSFFWSSVELFLTIGSTVFSDCRCAFELCFTYDTDDSLESATQSQTDRRPPKRGHTGAVAGNLSLLEPRWV
jgi:hypothetical protein